MDLDSYKLRSLKLASLKGLEYTLNTSKGLDCFLPILNCIRDDSSVVIIKMDGERSENVYTFLISGTKLGPNGLIRVDTSDFEGGLSFICVNYATQVWGLNV